ncbi:MAG: hypothetical protein E7214_15030 [Clostridium sp.]|nr:hypothetical protein [Clostridium sp.]
MENFIRILRAEDVNNVLEGNEKEVIEIVKDAYIMHNENLTLLPHSIFLRFPNDNVNRIIGLPAYVGGDVNMAGMKWISSFPNNTKNGIERASVHLTEQKLNTRDFIRCPLADILSGKQNNRVDKKPVMFSPFGLGILDIALGNYVYAEAEKAGYGVVVENFLP